MAPPATNAFGHGAGGSPVLPGVVFSLFGCFHAGIATPIPEYNRQIEGGVIAFAVQGLRNAQWYLQRGEIPVGLEQKANSNALASVDIDGTIAWRMLTKGIAKAEAAKLVEIEGDQKLGAVVMDTYVNDDGVG